MIGRKQGRSFNMKKLFLFLLLIVCIGAGVCFYYAGKVEEIVQRVGTETLGVPVEVTHIGLNPLSGTLTIDGFAIGNPKGFSTEKKSFSFETISVVAEPKTLFSDDVIKLQKVLISKPVILLEISPYGSNLVALRKQVTEHLAATKAGQPQDDNGQPVTSEQKKRIEIKELTLQEGQLIFASSLSGGMVKPVKLPVFTMKDIGTGQGGITAVAAVDAILAGIVGHAAGQNQLLGSVEEQGKQGLKALMQRSGGRLNQWLSK